MTTATGLAATTSAIPVRLSASRDAMTGIFTEVEVQMARKLPPKDVVIVGLGWTGSIMAYELADAGLDVIAIERGPWRNTATDYPPGYAADELRYRIRHELFLRPEQTTFTFRNKMNQTALPIRTWGAFMPPNGVGGGGVHWNAETWRFGTSGQAGNIKGRIIEGGNPFEGPRSR